MEIEDITWVSLSAGGSSQEERHLSVGDCLLGQIVIDDQAVLSVVSEVLTDGTAGVGGQELKRGSIRGGGSNDNGVLEGITLTEEAHDVRDGGTLLANGDVDAEKRLGQVTDLVGSLLVKNGVDSDGGLTSLSVTNDQLTLSSANGNL